MSKQSTLFQTWGKSKAKPEKNHGFKQTWPENNDHAPGDAARANQVVDLCDEDADDDIMLAMAMEASLQEAGIASTSTLSNQHTELSNSSGIGASTSDIQSRYTDTAVNQSADNTFPIPHTVASTSDGRYSHGKEKSSSLFKMFSGTRPSVSDTTPAKVVNLTDDSDTDVIEPELPSLDNIPDLAGFDKMAGRMWIYPTNYPVRKYQLSIVKECLLQNTLVILPTGLGKTFVAAVVMYNFYRWYPQGKIIFMAPTKPLVAQQIEACYNVMGIPQEDVAEMTGAMQPTERAKSWKQHRIFFLTPQVMMNDLIKGICPATWVKCLIIDEAHKALGNHAYCQVIKLLLNQKCQLRVVSLSATPGSDIKAVQQVLSNVLVSHVQMRTEECPDILPYSHERIVQKVVVPLGHELTTIRDKYLEIIVIIVARLNRVGALYKKDAKSLSKFAILRAREAFRQNPPHNMQRQQIGSVEGDFAICMSLYHGYELLQLHGLRSLYSYLNSLIVGDKNYGRVKSELQKSANFNEIMATLEGKFQPVQTPFLSSQISSTCLTASQQAAPHAVGHPKMDKLLEILLEHFQNFQDSHDSGISTRVMIFSQYRDSVNEITELLNRHRPLIKVMSFIGQSSAGKSSKGFSQKDQLKVMRTFRDGGYNTLVSTCVGEEGLDIGDVDLIVCFDAHKSPIRLVQRMGRTGRKRQGRIVMLVTEGKEEQVYQQSQYNKRRIHKALQKGNRSLVYYSQSPRMVPEGLHPVCHKMFITVSQKFSSNAPGRRRTATSTRKTAAKKQPAAKTSDGTLTEEETRFWKENLWVPDKDLPEFPESKMLTFNETSPLKRGHVRPTLSLNNWMPWQSSLQTSAISGHSLSSRHLVELLEFMEVQGVLDPEEDSYGLEMATYLNEEDIMKAPPGRRSSILSYCSPGMTIPAGRRTNVNTDEGTVAGPSRRKIIRRSDTLHKFSDEAENKTEEDTDACDVQEHTVCDEKADIIDVDPPTSKDTDSDTDIPAVVNMLSDTELPILTTTTMRKKRIKLSGKAIMEQKNTCSYTDKLESKSAGLRRRIKSKRKREPSGNTSLISVIQECDQDDFDDIQVVPDDMLPAGAASDGEKNIEVNETDGGDGLIEQKNHNVEPLENIKTGSRSLTATIDDEEQMRFSQLFPVFPLCTNDINFSKCREDIPSVEDCHDRSVKPPPALSEINAAFEEMDKKGRLSPLDILQLVDVWSKESDNESQSHRRSADEISLPNSRITNSGLPKQSIVKDPIHVTPCKDHMTINLTPVSDNDVLMTSVQWDEDGSNNVTYRDSKTGYSGGNTTNTDEHKKASMNETSLTSSALTAMMISPMPDMSAEKKNKTFSNDIEPYKVKSTNCNEIIDSLKLPSLPTEKVLSNKYTPIKVACEPAQAQTPGLFFDDSDDEILAAIRTPSAVLKPTSADTSQITFTQALACVNTSVVSDHSISPPPPHINTRQEYNKPSNHNALSSTETSSSVISKTCGRNLSPVKPSPIKESSTASVEENVEIKPHSDDVAHFDLGFDLDEDDFEDSMVIPPSPVLTQTFNRTTQQSLRSQESRGIPGMSGARRVLGLNQSIVKPNDRHSNVDDRKIDVTDLKNDNTAAPVLSALTSQSAMCIDEKEEIVIEDSEPLSQSILNENCPFTPANFKFSQKNALSHTMTGITSTPLAPTCKRLVAGHGTPVNVARVSPLRMEVSVMDEPVPEFDEVMSSPSLLASPSDQKGVPFTSYQKYSSSDVLPDVPMNVDSEFDDSAIVRPRKKKLNPVLTSPESSAESTFATPIRPISRKPVKPLSDDDSPVCKKSKTRQQLIISTESDDDFQDYNPENRSITRKKAAASTTSRPREVQRTKIVMKTKKVRRNEFIEHEAEESEECEGSGDDQDNSMLDLLEASFINDATQMSQADTSAADMRAIYLQSVKSPLTSGGRFKLQYQSRQANHSEIFSQYTEPDDTRYMQDSFCVDSDHIEYAESSSEENIPERPRRTRKTEKQKKKSPPVIHGRRRLRKVYSSSEDEAGGAGDNTDHTSYPRDNTQPKVFKNKKALNPVKSSTSSGCIDSDLDVSTMLSLESRCRAKMGRKGEGDNKSKNLRSASALNTKATEQCDAPTFSLGFDSFDDDEDSDVGDSHHKVTDRGDGPGRGGSYSVIKNNKKPQRDTQSRTVKNTRDRTACDTDTITLSDLGSCGDTSIAMSREERLRLSRLKQQQFRQSLASSQSFAQTSDSDVSTNVDKDQSVIKRDNERFGEMSSQSHEASSSVFCSPIAPKPVANKPVVVIDSSEVIIAENVNSRLQSTHHLCTVSYQIKASHYIISYRMGLQRKLLSDFVDASKKADLMECVRSLCEMFDRSCVIVEKDCMQSARDKADMKTLLKSQYVQTVRTHFTQMHIGLMFSDSQEDTARIIADLVDQERRKGFATLIPIDLTPAEQRKLKFYTSVPKVNFVSAVCLLRGYATIADFIRSDKMRIQKTGNLSMARAHEVYTYLRQQYSSHHR